MFYEGCQEADGTVDFLELIIYLWRQRLLIAVAVFSVLISVVSYVVMSMPVYEAKVFIRAVPSKNVFDVGMGCGAGYDLDQMYSDYFQGVYFMLLQSELVRRKFFDEVYLPVAQKSERSNSMREVYKKFRGKISIGVVSESAPRVYLVKFISGEPGRAEDLAYRYVRFVERLAKDEITQSLRGLKVLKSRVLKEEIMRSLEGALITNRERFFNIFEAEKVRESLVAPSESTILGVDGWWRSIHEYGVIEGGVKKSMDKIYGAPLVLALQQRQEVFRCFKNMGADIYGARLFDLVKGVEVSEVSISSRRLVLILLGLCIGVLLGGGLAYVRDKWRQCFLV